jgi:catechol 2,3-dioxygenase-like lactoylglutathione lyase family enzyme
MRKTKRCHPLPRGAQESDLGIISFLRVFASNGDNCLEKRNGDMRTIFGIHGLVWAGVLGWGVVMGARARADERPRILGISHVAVKVSDVEKAVAFYGEFLGLAEEYRLNDPKSGALTMVCFKVSDDQVIQLIPGRKEGESPLNHVAFIAADAEALRAYLAKQGIKTPAKVSTGQHKNLNFSVRDPDKFQIEFTQYTPDGWTVRDKGKFLPDTRVSDHIGHAGIGSADAEASAHFYGDGLGLKQVRRPTGADDTTPRYNMVVPETGTGEASGTREAGGTHDYVELMNADSKPHFCMTVPDIEKAKAKLEASPYRPKYEKPIAQRVGKNGKRIVEVYDPDGVRVEFMEMKNAE